MQGDYVIGESIVILFPGNCYVNEDGESLRLSVQSSEVSGHGQVSVISQNVETPSYQSA